MARILIITAAVLLLLGGVVTAFSGAENPDPGPAILLEEDPAGETGSGQGSGAAKGAEDGDAKKAGDYRDGGSDPFTVTQPQPVEAGDDEWDDDDAADDGWDDD